MTMIEIMGLGAALRRGLAMATMLVGITSAAAPGSPDTTFGAGNGVIFTSAGLGRSLGIAATGDGKIVRGVLTNYSTANVFRYRDDGTLDTSFNSTGRSVDVALPPLFEGGFINHVARATTVQPDGKALFMLTGERNIAGSGTTHQTGALVVRVSANGTVDSAFGTNGIATVEPSANAESKFVGLAMQPDGKILVAGLCVGTPCAVRLLPNGSPDAGFGVNGIANHSTAIGGGSVTSITALPDGRILMGGVCSAVGGAQPGFCASRFTATGTTDTAYASSGIARVLIPGTTGPFTAQLALGPDGSVLLAGTCQTPTVLVACMARIDVNGLADPTFNFDGAVANAFSGYSLSEVTVALQPDGRIVLAMTCTPTGTVNYAICVFRYNNDGFLDQSFGNVGRVLSNFSTGTDARDSVENVVLQPDGKVLVGGSCYNAALGYRPCIARYFGGPMTSRMCSMDIDGDGKVTGTIDSLIHARIAMGMTGSAVIGGITFPTAATRTTWPAVRDFLVMQCGMSLAP